jgi:hypothetical protein
MVIMLLPFVQFMLAFPWPDVYNLFCLERYRSGHNGADSKSKPFFVSLFSESLDIAGFFGVSQFHILLVLPIRSLHFPR